MYLSVFYRQAYRVRLASSKRCRIAYPLNGTVSGTDGLLIQRQFRREFWEDLIDEECFAPLSKNPLQATYCHLCNPVPHQP